MVTCQYCEKNFASKSTLYSHQKRAKYCLKIQKEKGIIRNIIIFKCKGCNKTFVTKREFGNHEERCHPLFSDYKNKKDLEMEQLKNEIERLKIEINDLKVDHQKEIANIYRDMNKSDKDCIHEIAKQPKTTTTNNNVSNKLKILTDSFDPNGKSFEKAVKDGFTENHFFGGQKGVARLVSDIVQSGNKVLYYCCDPKRGSFCYKDENENIMKDIEAKKLAKSTHGIIIPIAKKIMNDKNGNNTENEPGMLRLVSDNYRQLDKMDKSSNKFYKELAAITAK